MFKNKKQFTAILQAACFSTLSLFMCAQVSAAQNSLTSGSGDDDDFQLRKANIIYQQAEVFDFDVGKYLSQKAPHLLPFAETIAHVASESTISPKVLLALMEHQTKLISLQGARESDIAMPYGVMSQEYGFVEQLRDVAERMSKAYYRGHTFKETGKNQSFTSDADAQRAVQMIFSYGFPVNEVQPGSKEQLASFGEVFYEMFPEAKKAPFQKDASMTTLSVPSSGLLQFPFPRYQTWHIGGSHTSTGSGSWPQSSLDTSNGGGGWGSNTSNKWVSAAAAGTVRVYSSCSMEVFHSGGWSTSYYHLSNIRYNTGDYVNKNTAIANYANSQSQALCNGGSSTGPHVHWSLKLNGQYYHLNSVSVSGFKIQTGRYSYDTNCDYFRLIKNGYYYCSGNYYNSGSSGRALEEMNAPDVDEENNITNSQLGPVILNSENSLVTRF